MYRIGLFSKLTKVTVKALRFYEEAGLLAPERVDAVNGYRYYTSSQLPRVFRIVSLRQCGFSIAEIRSMLDGGDSERIFAARRRELEIQAAETGRQLAAINSYLATIEKEQNMPYQIILKELPQVLVYSLRTTVTAYDEYFELMPRLGAALRAVNPGLSCLEDPPYCFVRYLDGEYREHDISIEFCEAVSNTGNGTLPEGMQFRTIPKVETAACVLHNGPYSTLGTAYAALFRWIADSGYTVADCPRESYIDGIWNKADPSDWLTEVQVPLQHASD